MLLEVLVLRADPEHLAVREGLVDPEDLAAREVRGLPAAIRQVRRVRRARLGSKDWAS